MFIGTADDRYLRPHAFYQVHRITGKTVATASQEIVVTSTKVLEIPLLPENNMTAGIDCAGILKLRNSDIELRKGETDIGRKNTRVRVVFRVHIPQPNGKVLSLQAASIPVECCGEIQPDQLSGQRGRRDGHQRLNFFPESKVIFLEKGPDGRPQWEVEAKIMREKTQGSCIIVEVPPYHTEKEPIATLHLPISVGETGLPSPEQCHPSDGLLSGSPHGLLPLQGPCPSLGSPSFQHLPHLQSRSLHHPPADCHMTFHPTPAPLPAPPRPSYQSMQHGHSHSLPFNGQSPLPPQGYERMPFQHSVSAASHPMGMGMVYPSSPCSSPSAPPSSNSIAGSPQSQQPMLSPSSPRLHTLGGYHCSPNPPQVPSPGGHPLVGQHSSQLQRAMGYHPVGQRSASCPTPSSAPATRMIPSPHSGPSSPQLQSLPYQSPTSSSSPTSAGPLIHPLSPQGPFTSDKERPDIKEEPEEKEPTFGSIGLQDITLDDVNEIIGRDMSQSPSTHGPPSAHNQS
ncbi:Nuclear factor of activated T-cells cytoplasmic 3 [Dissostichus eleginoides]|uniref:Nuclear factor of activated T-cells cytoplasmic 3 n=1 Tax=Dissostichus eleginoides TaxID=100907 RepID=A0AAD9F3J6_DISEL|nr:Nuclear factor of activated T-cells cytoplasmic 3 [Dissostichus eleginoides]